ncbi:Phospholipase D p1 [Hibiscus syriacus]|uniref:phospholipase D n=1 Tax=Hibiscus syriacus TaxID=106335 RepID=A0A6A2YLJ0_HIBSY|nr:Phospholipase D p1 [Hibiscus syriacus]
MGFMLPLFSLWVFGTLISPFRYANWNRTETRFVGWNTFLPRFGSQRTIYILLYKELDLALKINSVYSKRASKHFSDGVYLWSHHEKLVIVDYHICFIGGLDLCIGRYDTFEHKVGDNPPLVWPGKDYYNPRESEPNSWEDVTKDELDRGKYPRMPWHDVHCALWRPPCRDVARHFVQRWNYAKRNKALYEETIPLLMPQHHMVIPHYMGRSKKIEIESKNDLDNSKGVKRHDSFCSGSAVEDIPLFLPQEAELDTCSGYPKSKALDSNGSKSVSFAFQKSKIEPSVADMPVKGFVDDLDSLDLLVERSSDAKRQPGSKAADPEWWETQERDDQVGFVNEAEQIIRSVSQWSAGTSQIEESIHCAYCSLIEKAEHFVYIENQFFTSGLSGDEIIRNRVLEALYRRIMRAYNDKKCFRVIIVIPLLPGFQGGLDDAGAASLRAIMHWQYRTICRGQNSIWHKLYEVLGPKKHDYISFYGLRSYGKLSGHGPVATSPVYVHSKIMVIDDSAALIESANINDRSLLGSRDSEMGGNPREAGKFTLSLRLSLWSEHLGLRKGEINQIIDPISDSSYKDKWDATAKNLCYLDSDASVGVEDVSNMGMVQFFMLALRQSITFWKERLGHTAIDLGIAPEKLESYHNGNIKQTGPMDRLKLERLLTGSMFVPSQTVLNEVGKDVPNELYEEFVVQDSALASWLLSTISPQLLPQFVGTETASAGDESMRVYRTRVKEVCDALASCGSVVSQAVQVASILKGLPREYQPFVVVITTMCESVSLDAIYTMLLDAKTQLVGVCDPLESLPMSAHVAQGQISSKAIDQSECSAASRQTYSCGRSTGRGRGRARLQCQLCGKTSHLVDRCWHRFDEDFPGVTTNNNAYSKNESSTAYYAANNNRNDVGCDCGASQKSSFNKSQAGREQWIVDSGATHHVTSDDMNVSQPMDFNNLGKLTVGDGVALEIKSVGKYSLYTPTRVLLLTDLLQVPRITKNLLSVSKLARDNNIFFEFHAHECCIRDKKTGVMLLRGKEDGGLYPFALDSSISDSSKAAAYATQFSTTVYDLWHQRLGHPSHESLVKVCKELNIILPSSINKTCVACHLGKNHKLPFFASTTVYETPFQLVFTDLWGPSHVVSNGYKYYVTFVDECTRHSWLYLLTDKAQAVNAFEMFQQMVLVQFDLPIKVVQSYWGGEYRRLSNCLLRKDITHRLTCPHTSKKNGVVERKHRHVIELALVLLTQASMPVKFWAYTVATAVHLINRLPTRVLQGVSPFEKLYHKKPDYGQLQVFFPFAGNNGHTAVTSNMKSCSSPLQVVTDVTKLLSERGVEEAGHTSMVNSSGSSSSSTGNLPGVNSGYGLIENTCGVQDVEYQASGKFSHTGQDTGGDKQDQAVSTQGNDQGLNQWHNVVNTRTMTDAQVNRHPMLTRSKCGIFKPKAYMTAAVDEVPGCEIVGCKWLFKVKKKPDGYVKRHKACLVAKGYSQVTGCDFKETYSHVVKFPTLNAVLAFAIAKNWPLRQIDVNNAFLNGDLTEDVFMQQPPRFEEYADDGGSSRVIDGVVQALNQEFSLKDLGKLSYFFANAREYGSIVGALLYVFHTRPDVAFSVNKEAQYMHAPREFHLAAVKRILRYLAGTFNYGLTFSGTGSKSFEVVAFVDADWGGSLDDRRLVSGHMVFLGACPVVWCSRKHKTISRTIMEAEYRSIAEATAEVTWVSSLLGELGVGMEMGRVRAGYWSPRPRPHLKNRYPSPFKKLRGFKRGSPSGVANRNTPVNTSAVVLSTNPVYHAMSKHVDIDVHFVREKVAAQAAGEFTKP